MQRSSAAEVAAPAPADPSRLHRITPPLLLGGGVLAASVALHLRDPHQAGAWGFCPWYAMTGTSCPGCGGLRAVNDLTHGDLAAAASSNLLFVTSIPLLVTMWLRSFRQRWAGVYRPVPQWVTMTTAGVVMTLMVVFTVVRNVPFGSWLAP